MKKKTSLNRLPGVMDAFLRPSLFAKIVAKNKIRSQPYFGEAPPQESDTIKFRRPVSKALTESFMDAAATGVGVTRVDPFEVYGKPPIYSLKDICWRSMLDNATLVKQ